MAQSMRKLSRFLRQEVNVRFNPLCDPSYTCGMVLDIDGPLDVDPFDDLARLGVAIPEVTDHLPVTLPKLDKSSEVGIDARAGIEFLKKYDVEIGAGATIGSTTQSAFHFSDVTHRYVLRGALESAIAECVQGSGAGVWQTPLGRALTRLHHHVVFQEYWGKLTISFHNTGSGNAHLGLQVGEVVGVSGRVEWKVANDYSLQTTAPVMFAIETARYRKLNRDLIDTT